MRRRSLNTHGRKCVYLYDWCAHSWFRRFALGFPRAVRVPRGVVLPHGVQVRLAPLTRLLAAFRLPPMTNSDKVGTTDFGYQRVPLDEKARRVGEVFSSVAGRYDLMN